jgi:translocation and assembly module TamB
VQDHLPMWLNLKSRFVIDGGRLRMEHIEIESDGATTVASGDLDLSRWPDMRYSVRSRVHFARMREIFFRNETWARSGDGDFTGIFRLFKGGHDLSGTFRSALAGVNDYRFPRVQGALEWRRDGFKVWDARADLYGGQAEFGFSIAPLGAPERPTARFDARYSNVDVSQLSDLYELPGLRFAGSATGRNLLEWPLGHFRESRGDGEFTIDPPGGASMMRASLDSARAADPDHSTHEWGPFAPHVLPAHLPVGASVSYTFDPDAIQVSPSRFATEKTHVAFEGETAWGDPARFAFRVTSSDWQESDQVLAGILTDFGARTGPVAFGGRGDFDGAMTGSFRRPHVEGVFNGEDMRAWDTLWGDGRARIVVENSYVTVTGGTVRRDGSEIRADGRFSLGYPRRDGGEELDARIRVSRRDLDSLRHAFAIDAYPVSGRMSGEFSLRGGYQTPIGFGAMTIEDGVAYGEPFERGTSTLRFDGAGVRLDNVNVAMQGGAIAGAAYVGWDSTYSFNVDARLIPVERTAAFAYPALQPSGLIEFTAGGSGTFDVPRYDVRFQIADLFVADEGVGQVTGTLALRGEELSGEIEAASPRLAVTGTGRISLAAGANAELALRFYNSSLDPYVRLLQPRLSPFTTAVASGSIRVAGDLADYDRLVVDATVDSLEMRLFDYAVRNARPIRLALDRQVVRVQELELLGDETRLRVDGIVALNDQRIALRAVGDANLGILQGFFRDVRGSGRAELVAAIDGPLYEPVFTGSATIADGRIRHFSMPNSLDAVNGTIHFDSSGLRLDDVAATLGGGRVQFGGRIGLEGYLPADLNVVARGEGMQLRVLDGVRSTIDADLTVRGNFQAPVVGGVMTVRSAVWTRRIDPTAGLFDFAGGGEEGGVTPAAPTIPLRFDLDVRVPSTLRIENNLARLVASADLQLRGTYDRPLLFGRVDVDRGEVIFEGRRYLVTRGAIDFTNPSRIEPFFDVEAESRVRVPGQTYRVIVSAAGTMDRLQPQLSSDPPLPPADVVALLFSDVRRGQDVELRAQRNANEREADILATRATALVASPISAEVGRVVEQTFGVDTFQVTPSLLDPYSQSATARVNPSARVTIGKRISDRLFLTFSRSLNSSMNDQLLLLEYDESDRLSWILSRNEDASYAIEVRVRHTF